jgi:hypothetical protein
VAVLRRLLIALLLASPAVVMSQMTAHAACSCQAGTYQESVEAADVVFSGLLTNQSTGRTAADGGRETTYQVEAERVYKGDVTTADVDVVSPRDDCTLGTLETDRRYMFFVTESGAEFMTDRCSGTGVANDEMVRRVERLLGEGQDVTAPPPAEPEEVEFTKVADAEPETLSRLAAPGAALVIVGLLGLLLVGRLSRRE